VSTNGKRLSLLLAALLLWTQVQLWGGRGSLTEVRHLRQLHTEQVQRNELARQRNSTLAAEVHDLKVGRESIEELARSELAMVHPQETFYQVVKVRKPEPRPD